MLVVECIQFGGEFILEIIFFFEVYCQVVDQVDLVILIIDVKVNIFFVNEVFVWVIGYSCDEIIGWNESVLFNYMIVVEIYQVMWKDLKV